MAFMQKIKQRLTDGWHVFDVSMASDLNPTIRIKFHCVTEADADRFMRIIEVAIENHTTDMCDREDDLGVAS